MSRLLVILIAIAAVLITGVVCYLARKPIKRTASRVWKAVMRVWVRVSNRLKKQKKLVKCTCGSSHLT